MGTANTGKPNYFSVRRGNRSNEMGVGVYLQQNAPSSFPLPKTQVRAQLAREAGYESRASAQAGRVNERNGDVTPVDRGGVESP